MAGFEQLICRDDTRRALIRASETLNGIDYVEMVTEPATDNQRVMDVFFIPKNTAPGRANLAAMIEAIRGDFANLMRITGGVRIRDVEIVEVRTMGDHLQLRVNHPGDFSDYLLSIDYTVQPGGDPAIPKLDPAYAEVEFNFKAACPSQFDCRARRVCEPEEIPEAAIDYQAKDYASFRQVLLDRIAETMPEWTERSVADLGIALVELFAYTGDHLSYYQDAVANEAFLETARQRISIRRHARLIDYAIHDGASARVFVFVRVAGPGVLPVSTSLLTKLIAPLPSGAGAPPIVIPDIDAAVAKAAAAGVFETFDSVNLDPILNDISIHAWGMEECCHPRGTTSLDLAGSLIGFIRPGSYLLFEEVLGTASGEAQDADPGHRQIVRLTGVQESFDPAANQPLTRVSWSSEDALRFPLCVSLRIGEANLVRDVTVARGNLVLADHGETIVETHLIPAASSVSARPHRFRLSKGPLAFRLPAADAEPAALPAAADPRQAVAQVHLDVRTKDDTVIPGWTAQQDLLSSEPEDLHFTVEVDNSGRAQIRFGDDTAGMAPPAEATIQAAYRIGAGARGNFPAESIRHAISPRILPSNWPNILSIRNPLGAFGGTEPESLEEIKLAAPAALREGLLRAVTEEDYGAVASRCPGVSRAVATFRWTGTWHTVFLTVDPKGRTDLDAQLEERVRNWVTRFAQAGYDLEIEPPVFVPIEIEVDVCVKAGYFPSDVQRALDDALGNRRLAGGRAGFFHPDLWTFGQPLYLSQVYAAIADVLGVMSARIRVFKRLGKMPDQELQNGVIRVRRTEIIRLDNDRNAAENGVLIVNLKGAL